MLFSLCQLFIIGKMASGGRRSGLSNEEILKHLQLIDSDISNDSDSTHEDDENELYVPPSPETENDSSDEDTSCSFHGPPVTTDVIKTKSGVIWNVQTDSYNTGRVSERNILKVKPGPTSYTKRFIKDDDPLSAFWLLLDNSILKMIQNYTTIHGKRTDQNFSVSMEDIEKLIGIQYTRGFLVAKSKWVME